MSLRISPGSVAEVWVDGRRLLEAGVPTTVDEAAQIAQCRTLAKQLQSESRFVADGLSRL
jgi:hypothetical protein